MLFIAATVQGWTQTATNGANLSWPVALNLDGNTTITAATDIVADGADTAYGTTSCTHRPSRIWAYAAVNAAPYLAAGV
jgi:hypothetical protein